MVSTGHFLLIGPRPDEGWFHVVINFIGPNDGQGFKVYNDGLQEKGRKKGGVQGEGANIIGSTDYPPSDGRIVLGRSHTNFDGQYSSVYIDELYFYNTCLTKEQITRLSQ